MSTQFRLTFVALLVLTGCAGSNSSTTPSSSATKPEDPVVARLADTTLTLSDFERAYRNANDRPTPSSDSLEAYQEFLEQYVNYRLKVRAAEDAGLDTLSSLEKEVRSYRNEMARPRLMRSQVYEPLVRALYERRKKEVDVSHILLRVGQNASPADTLEAYRQMEQIVDSLQRGVSFGDLAYRNSEDPSAQREGQPGFRGRLGFIRAGQIVEPFEKRMYSVPPDSVSDIFRSRFGYHVLKVHERRRAQPAVRLSHILVRDSVGSQSPRRFLDSLRTALVSDSVSFSVMAETYSQDRRSAAKGGDLGMVESLRTLPSPFRDAVTRLDTVGAVSPVVETRFGYHLIKLTDRKDRPSFEEAYDELKEQISGRPRVERQKKAFARSIHSEVGVSVDSARIVRHAAVPSLDTLSRPLLSIVDADTSSRVPIATLGDSTFTLSQLAQHVMQTDGGALLTVGEVLQDFLDEKAFQYAQERLGARDPEFREMMNEYRDGLLAFQFMQDSVWTPASEDTSGLRKTYRRNRESYRMPVRVRAIVLRAPADSLLSGYETLPADTSNFDTILGRAGGDSLVTADTVTVPDSSSGVYHRVWSVSDGETVGPVSEDGDALLLIRDTLLSARPKTFEEARSSVLRDYQDEYEERILSRLRKKYRVETYPNRLRRAFD